MSLIGSLAQCLGSSRANRLEERLSGRSSLALPFIEVLERRALLSAGHGHGACDELRDAAGIDVAANGADEKTHKKGDKHDSGRADENSHKKKARKKFAAELSGSEEVPPRETDASGDFRLKVIRHGTAFKFALNVENIENVFAAHLHLGERGENGPIVVTLFGPVEPGGGPFSGRLASGIFTEADFEGPLAGASAEEFRRLLKAGEIYVNVHTDDGVPPPDTGPGDFPGGEIRGQVFAVKKGFGNAFASGKEIGFDDKDDKDDKGDKDDKDNLYA